MGMPHQTPFPWRTCLSVGFVALLIAATLAHFLRTGGHMTEVCAPLAPDGARISFGGPVGLYGLQGRFAVRLSRNSES